MHTIARGQGTSYVRCKLRQSHRQVRSDCNISSQPHRLLLSSKYIHQGPSSEEFLRAAATVWVGVAVVQIRHVYSPGGKLTRHIMCMPDSLQRLGPVDVTRQLVHLSVQLAARAIDLEDLDGAHASRGGGGGFPILLPCLVLSHLLCRLLPACERTPTDSAHNCVDSSTRTPLLASSRFLPQTRK